VFRNEATGAAQVVAGRFGSDPVDVQYNSKKSGGATIEALRLATAAENGPPLALVTVPISCWASSADPSAYSQGRSPFPTEASRVSTDRVRAGWSRHLGSVHLGQMKDEALLVETPHRYGCGSSRSAHGKLINAASFCRNATCGDNGDCSRWVALTELPDSVVLCEANRNG
jgi:hypothetical protein